MTNDQKTTIGGIVAGVSGAAAVGAQATGMPVWFTLACAMLFAAAASVHGYFSNKLDPDAVAEAFAASLRKSPLPAPPPPA